jgi:sulfur-oxidizing protein SoxZ
MSLKPRIRVPGTVKAGEIVEVRTLVTHVMETGQRRTIDGRPIPRNIIHTFTAEFDGRPVFKADLNSGISANPYIAFRVKIEKAGQLVLTWTEDSGAVTVERASIAIS